MNLHNISFSGKTGIITGAAQGIGKAIAKQFVQMGGKAVIVDINPETAAKACEEIGNAVYYTVDLGNPDEVVRVFQQIVEEQGKVEVLINNAGISYIGLLTDMSIDDWNRIVSTNLTSVFSTSRLAIPHMVHEKKGKIINISSVWGIAGASCEVAYSACKGGINSFTRALAKELAPSNIQVNAIACGVIDTEMNACFSEEERAQLAEEIPAGRFGAPEEVASLAVQITTGNDYLTGQIITLDGGYL